MRAPQSFADFSAAEWKAIKEDVRRRGYDADTVLVHGLGKRGPRPLRKALLSALEVILASTEFRASFPTAHQVAKHLTEKRRATLDFIKYHMDSSLLTYGHDLTDGLDEYVAGGPSPIPHRDRMHKEDSVLRALLEYAKALEAEAARFKTGPPNKNAAKPTEARNRYLAYVLRVWHEICGEKVSGKETVRFLFHCTEPVFSGITSQNAVENWLDRQGGRVLKRS
jgi:hypothetical protein